MKTVLYKYSTLQVVSSNWKMDAYSKLFFTLNTEKCTLSMRVWVSHLVFGRKDHSVVEISTLQTFFEKKKVSMKIVCEYILHKEAHLDLGSLLCRWSIYRLSNKNLQWRIPCMKTIHRYNLGRRDRYQQTACKTHTHMHAIQHMLKNSQPSENNNISWHSLWQGARPPQFRVPIHLLSMPLQWSSVVQSLLSSQTVVVVAYWGTQIPFEQ